MKGPAIAYVLILFTGVNCLFCVSTSASEPPRKLSRPIPSHHTVRDLDGWTVRVDDRLLATNNSTLGSRAVKLLEARLVAIAAVMPDEPLKRLRQVTIQIDLTYGDLDSMAYHPSPIWLRDSGYNTNLAKCVHVPDAAYFASPFEAFRQPMAILHELAHAYHDQVLGTDEPRIRKAWQKFRDCKRYGSVLMNVGVTREHYGLVNHEEFFAEMTEAYFGENDFFPFVAGELERAEPEIFALMCDIWGPLPSKARSD
jgi:hypothetical protein